MCDKEFWKNKDTEPANPLDPSPASHFG